MTPEYITKDTLKETLIDWSCDASYIEVETKWALEEIKNIPAADVAPVVHGKWIVHKWSDDDDWGYIDYKTITCSNCGYRQEWSSLDRGHYIKESPYCPECGAKMDGE